MSEGVGSAAGSGAQVGNKGLPSGFPLNLAALTAAVSAVAVLYGGVRAFYFEGAFVEAFSYYSDERPFNEIINSLIGRDPATTLFGVHAFGDYLIGNVWSSLPDPWSDITGVNYLPPVLLVFRLLGFLPYSVGFTVFAVGIFLATVAPMVFASRGYALATRTLLVIVLAVMTGPALTTLDRGNIQGLLPVLLFSYAIAVLKQRWGLAAAMIAAASLIKIYPIVLLLLLLALRKYKWVALSAVFSLVGVLISLPIMSTRGFASFDAMIAGVLQFQEKSVVDFLQYNVSFAGGLANAAFFVGLPSIGTWIAGNAWILIVGYAAAVIPILWIRSIELWMRLIIVLSLTTALMPIVYGYALNWVLAASALAVWVSRHSEAGRMQARVVTVGLMVVLAMGSSVLPFFIPGSMESGRPAGAVTLAALTMYLLLPLVAYGSRRMQAVGPAVAE